MDSSSIFNNIYKTTFIKRPSTIEEAAQNHANIFVNDVLLKATTSFGSPLLLKIDKQLFIDNIYSYFLTLFKTNIKSSINLLSVPYMVLSSSIVTYIFSNCIMSNTPTPDPTITPSSSLSNIILFSGEPISFGTLLYNAFISGKNAKTIQEGATLLSFNLSTAYLIYMKTISGNYLGTQTTPNGLVPIIIPWIGLS